MKTNPFPKALNELARGLKDLSYNFHSGGKAIGSMRFGNERLAEAVAGIASLLDALGDRTYKAAWDLDGYAIWIETVLRGHKGATRYVSRPKCPVSANRGRCRPT